MSSFVFSAHVRTLDPTRPEAEAVAVRDGRVVAVGSLAECRLALPEAAVVDFGDATLLPGLHDAHGHVLGLGEFRDQLDLRGTRSEEDLVERAAAAAALGEGWLRGFGWDQTAWPGGAFPTNERLSAAVPHRPVLLTRVDGHSALVNREALRRAGFSAKTVDPPGGAILRGSDGEPTGVLVDRAMEILRTFVPSYDEAERTRLLLDALHVCASVGLVAVHDAGMDAPTLALMERLDAEGRLPIRVYAMIDARDEGAMRSWLPRGPWKGRNFEVRAVKLYLDGALGSRGACFCQPYSDDPTNRGLQLLTPDALRQIVRRIDEAGFQVAMHAIGDAANAAALDALETCGVTPEARPRLEHAQVIHPVDVERAARLGVIASVQPTHCTSDMPWMAARLGAERLPHAFAWRAMLRAGLPLALGSDFPIESPDPRLGLFAAITRQCIAGGDAFFPDESLTLNEALAGFCGGAAWASFAEESAGRIAPGCRADFTVLGGDPLEVAPRALIELPVCATVVGGEIVHRAPGPVTQNACG